MSLSPLASSPATANMWRSYMADGTVVYKSVSGVSTPPYQGGGGGVNGHPPAKLTDGMNTTMGEPLKRKRGRPRKYWPDVLAVVPVSVASACAPPKSDEFSPTLPAETANPTSASTSATTMKKAGGQTPGTDRMQQMDGLGLAANGSAPHPIAAKTGEIGEDTLVEEEANSKKNVMWTAEMDCCLTDALVEQMHRGNKIDKCFTNSAYLAACDAVYVKFRMNLSVPHLKNRLKTLKKDLASLRRMENSACGFCFNQVTKMMDAEPGVWDAYIEAHPEAKQYRHKPVPSYENLCIIFGKDRLLRQGSKTTKKMCLHTEKNLDVINGNTRAPLEEIEIEIHGDSGGESKNTSGMPKQAPNGPSLCKPFPKMAPKRKHGTIDDLKEEFSMLKSRIDAAASAVERSAPHMIAEEKLFEEVRKIGGLGMDFQLLAYDYLCQDITRGRTFIGLPINLRKRWLELKLDLQ